MEAGDPRQEVRFHQLELILLALQQERLPQQVVEFLPVARLDSTPAVGLLREMKALERPQGLGMRRPQAIDLKATRYPFRQNLRVDTNQRAYSLPPFHFCHRSKTPLEHHWDQIP